MSTAYLPLDERVDANAKRRTKLIAMAFIALFATVAFILFPEWINTYLNPALWITANALLLWTYGALIFYWAIFYFGFRWRVQPAGRIIVEQSSSLVYLATLSVIGIFFSPTLPNQWIEYPEDSLVWRPFLRVLVYFTVARAFTISGRDLVRRYRAGDKFKFEATPRTAKVDQ